MSRDVVREAERRISKEEEQKQEECGEAPLIAGSRVRIDGLSLAPTLNGQIAKVVCFDDSHGRYTVRLANSSEVKRVRPENLNQASDGVEGDGDDDAQSVDSMKLESSGASAAVSSSSSSDDGLGRTPKKKKRKRMPQEEAPKPSVPRSLFQSMSHDVVREAKRRISKEQDQLSWCENA